MTHYSNLANTSSSSTDITGVLLHTGTEEHVGGPRIVAMDKRQTQHQEAYYLFFVASMGMALNLLVIIMIFVRHNLRRMTSAFLVHAAFLNLLRAAFCIPFGLNLLKSASNNNNQPSDCNFQGSMFIVLVTASAVNMVAMICTEAYTFGEVNVGGNAHGTSCCILFGLLVVYITSVILHLGPTLIGGDIVYNPDIGSCAFKLGSVTGYVANVMWIVIITFSFVGVGHFLNKLYKEIQSNRPNRVSMLVRHSITIVDQAGRKPSACTVHEMTEEALHRAKIFVITAIAFALCWYPLFLLIIIDIHFNVSAKVYQAFSFIAWTQAMVEPIILIFFDRNLNLLARYMYCDRDAAYTATQIAYLMAQNRQQNALHHSELEELSPGPSSVHNNSIEMVMGEPFLPVSRGASASGVNTSQHSAHVAPAPSAFAATCRHGFVTAPGETTPLRTGTGSSKRSASSPLTTSTNEIRTGRNMDFPMADDSFEMDFSPVRHDLDPIRRRLDEQPERREDDVAC